MWRTSFLPFSQHFSGPRVDAWQPLAPQASHAVREERVWRGVRAPGAGGGRGFGCQPAKGGRECQAAADRAAPRGLLGRPGTGGCCAWMSAPTTAGREPAHIHHQGLLRGKAEAIRCAQQQPSPGAVCLSSQLLAKMARRSSGQQRLHKHGFWEPQHHAVHNPH